MKVYAGAPAAARCYVEADRGRADDYYLAEGAGVARRFTATDGRVTELAPLTGDGYEAWVAGRDPDTGEPRGQLRTDPQAVRFVEVVVNGPKSWSLAAALHPDIAAAYEAAQDRAAGQIIGWLSQHATTRVGPRGGQVQVPVQVLEAVTVRHFTSRANDPHWHLHLQFLSRVFAARKWRGLHTVGVRDFLAAINGIGHAAMACDPELNAAFAAHGYTTDATGEILELAAYVGEFSARNAQIARNVDRYEREWIAAHPGERPGPALRRSWDARAWAEGRPDKVTPQPGADIGERWRTELHDLGYRDPARPTTLRPTPVGALERDELVDRALSRLAAARSGWNAADVRGEAERLIAAAGIVAEPGVRAELAEDLTARALGRCVPLVRRDGVPEHIRAWTSRPVLAVEADLTARLAYRATERPTGAVDPGALDPGLTPSRADLTPRAAATAGRLDPGQAAAAVALTGDRTLLVVEGAAGAGKTTTLAATRTLLENQGRRMVVVTPTLKAAKVAAAEVGAAAGSAARLAFEHGWRWDDDGQWTRLAVGQIDPATSRPYTGPAETARLRPGDLLVVDEAGMLDQDTARALLTVADECRVRVALLGDRHQLAAVGRGGVLDLAVAQVDADAYLTLRGLHRFTRTSPDGRTVPDVDYADLTLAMRAGEDPGKVFDALLARGQIRIHADPEALRAALAQTAAASYADRERIAVVADTRDQVAELNTAIRDRLAAAGRVDDLHATVTAAGQWVGVGDLIVTRRNDADLDVANRDTWIVTAVGRDGGLLVTPADNPADIVGGNVHGDVTRAGTPAGMVRGNVHGDVTPAVTPRWPASRMLPADYVAAHVELAYASTAHGAQGDTVTAAHLVVGEHTGAASAYVGMTRGRQANTAHLVAADADQAREQWLAVFARDRADLGPAHAARQAAAEAARYANPRPLDAVLADLRAASADEQDCLDWLTFAEPRRDALRQLVALKPALDDRLTRCTEAYETAAAAAEQTAARARASESRVSAEADRIGEDLLDRWDAEREAARRAATVLLEGPGRLGLHRGAVRRATEEVTDWAERWRPYLPQLPTDAGGLGYRARGYDNRPAVAAALHAAAQAGAERAHPDHTALTAAADTARRAHDQARHHLAQARREQRDALARYGALAATPDPGRRMTELETDIARARQELTDVRARITRLTAEPALRAQAAQPALLPEPAAWLRKQRDTWRAQADRARARAAAPRRTPTPPTVPRPQPQPYRLSPHHPRSGPSLGR